MTLIYSFNPFSGEVLLEVLARIRTPLRKPPRELRLICKVPAQSAFEKKTQRHPWLVKEREMIFDANSRYLLISTQS